MASTFLSLAPACACGKSAALDVFSMSNGRRVRRIAQLSLDGFQLATPAATNAGRVYLTLNQFGRCSKTGYMECPHWIAGSCRNQVQTIAPGRSEPQVAFNVAGSEKIGEVVPSAHGRQVAYQARPCVSSTGTSGMYIRDLRSGHTRAVMSSTNVCDQYGPAAWNANSTEIAFPYEPAGGRPMEMAGGFACPEGRNYLVIATTVRGSGPRIQVPAGRGCLFEATAFDRSGIVAAEGCAKGGPARQVAPNVGDAFLLQYSVNGRLEKRIALKRGLEQAELSTEPHTGNVLVTQDRPANEPYPEADYVWVFNGQRLRPIARYPAHDAAQVLGVAW